MEQARVWVVGSRLFSELGRKGRYVVYTPAREREGWRSALGSQLHPRLDSRVGDVFKD